MGVERQLPKNMTLSVTYTHSRGVDVLRSRNIKCAAPGTYDPLVPGSGVFPYGDIGNIYLYESSGLFNQNQVIDQHQCSRQCQGQSLRLLLLEQGPKQ